VNRLAKLLVNRGDSSTIMKKICLVFASTPDQPTATSARQNSSHEEREVKHACGLHTPYN